MCVCDSGFCIYVCCFYLPVFGVVRCCYVLFAYESIYVCLWAVSCFVMCLKFMCVCIVMCVLVHVFGCALAYVILLRAPLFMCLFVSLCMSVLGVSVFLQLFD